MRGRFGVGVLLVLAVCLAAPVAAQRPPFRTAQLPGSFAEPPAFASVDPADPPAPHVVLRVRAPATAAPGQPLEYRLRVDNLGRGAAHHVTIRNPRPANATLEKATPPPDRTDKDEWTWLLRTLPGCASRDIVLVLKPTGDGDVRNCARVQYEHGQCVTTRLSRPRGAAGVALRVAAPPRAAVNDTITIRLVVSNTGSAEARGLVVTETLDQGLVYADAAPTNANEKQFLRWPSGDGETFALAAGESRTFEYRAVVRKEGRLCGVAEVTGPGGVLDRATHCLNSGTAALRVHLAGPDGLLAGRPARFTISVENAGIQPATTAVATLPLPPGVDLVEASPGGSLRGDQVVWPLGTLEPGGRPRSLWVRLSAARPVEANLRATASADGGVRQTAQLAADFAGAAGLTVVTEPDDNPTFVGDKTGVTVTVVNQGTDAARGVQVTVEVPPQMRIGDKSAPEGVQVQGTGQSVVFGKVAEIAPRGEVKLRLALEPIRAGDVRLVVKLTAERPAIATPQERQTAITIADPN